MEIQKTKHQLRLEQWRVRVSACRNSGLTVRAWCNEQGINQSTYYRWEHELCQQMDGSGTLATVSKPTFAELSLPTQVAQQDSDVAIQLRLGGAVLDIHNGADPSTIAATVRVLQSLC